MGVSFFSFSFSMVSLSSLRSSLVPTRMMGVLGQWCLTSGYHWRKAEEAEGQRTDRSVLEENSRRQILKKHSKTKEKVSALQSRLTAAIPRDAFSPRNWHPLTTLSPIRWCHMMVFVTLWSRHTPCLVLLIVFLHLQHSTLDNTSYLQVKFTSELKWCAVVRSQALTSADLRNTFQVTKIFHRYSELYCAAVSKGCFDSFLRFRNCGCMNHRLAASPPPTAAGRGISVQPEDYCCNKI